MSLALVDLLREIPPFQDALAMTGYVPARQVSKDFKMTFDAGACRVWTILKAKTNNDLKFLAVFMDSIEKNDGGEPKEENVLIFFKQLKASLKTREFIFLLPKRLPIDAECFGLCGPKYVKDAIPEEIQNNAYKIDQLKALAGSNAEIPDKFACAVSFETIGLKELSYKVGTVPSFQ